MQVSQSFRKLSRIVGDPVSTRGSRGMLDGERTGRKRAKRDLNAKAATIKADIDKELSLKN